MIKKLTLLAVVTGFILTSAGIIAQDKEVTLLKPSEFPSKAESLLGQNVQIEGLVVHVCKHGGKKMYIVGDDPEIRVKIDATVSVMGVVQPAMEEEIPESEKKGQDADHTNYYHQKQFSISCREVKVVD